jgi:hypothetical protein
MVFMQREHMKSAIVGGWVLGLGALAFSINVSSASGWALLAGLGLLPPLVFLRMWQTPAPTMSESIREVLK